MTEDYFRMTVCDFGPNITAYALRDSIGVKAAMDVNPDYYVYGHPQDARTGIIGMEDVVRRTMYEHIFN